jgi:hypothetical protein
MMNQAKIFAFLDGLTVGQRLVWNDDPIQGTYLGNHSVRWDDGYVWTADTVNDDDLDFLRLACGLITICGEYSPSGCNSDRSIQQCPEQCKQDADGTVHRVPLLVSVARLLSASFEQRSLQGA